MKPFRIAELLSLFIMCEEKEGWEGVRGVGGPGP